MESIKILLVTHSAAVFTGLAEVTRVLFSSLAAVFPGKYDISQLGLMHLSAVATPEWPIFPTEAERLEDGQMVLLKHDLNGQRSFSPVIERIRPDIVFAFNDPQNLEFLCAHHLDRNWKLILYVTFDGVPVPTAFRSLISADLIVTMSDFAKRAYLRSIGSQHCERVLSMYAPADTGRFKPSSPDEKKALRESNFPEGLPKDAFVIGWVGRNQWRKQVWAVYEVVGRLRAGSYFVCDRCGTVALREGPHSCNVSPVSPAALSPARPLTDIYLWVHIPTGKEKGCWPLEQLERVYDLEQGKDVFYTDGCSARAHLVPEDMPELYRMWDALLFLSGGEGFGVPAWEAMSSGLPIVYTNYSAHGEFISRGQAGLPVSGTLQPEPRQCTLRMIPRIEEAVQAIRNLYFDENLRNELGCNGRKFVSNFRPEVVARDWDKLFTEVLRR